MTNNKAGKGLKTGHTSGDPFPPRGSLKRTPATGFAQLQQLVLPLVLCLTTPGISASEIGELPDDLTSMSIEALMDIEITSVAKKPQKQSEAAAAIFVITNDDLRRRGVTSIPEALRYVPGLNVARIDANKWAITSRGFNSRFANKLLVLIDGRSVYTPLFAGVYWETHDVPLEDIERIEVIRGPGGTLWGANAVNGVINIITKSASDTQGTLLAAGIGNEERGGGTLRHGGKLQNGADYRIYAKYSSHDEGYSATDTHDDWNLGQVGFRTDWGHSNRDSFTLQGDAYRGAAGELVNLPTGPSGASTVVTPVVGDTDVSGGNLLFRWERTLNESSDFMLQAYLDHVSRDEVVLFEDRDILDIDFQHHLRLSQAHDVLWGLGYRHTDDDTDNNAAFSLTPPSRHVHLASAFLQDEISLTESVRLTVGAKLEHNSFTRLEFQPNVRLARVMDNGQTLWAAVSRAVRTPARGEHNVRLRLVPSPDPGAPVYATGNDSFKSEELLAYELGYRLHPHNNVKLDITAFYHDYHNLRTFDAANAPPADVLFPFDNHMKGETYGLEIATQWRVNPDWRLNGSYSYLHSSLELESPSVDAFSKSAEDASPRHQASLLSSHDLGNNLEFDAGLRFVDDIKVTGVDIDSYVELDARIGWKPRPGIELSVTGANLLDKHHTEFLPDFIATQPTEIERSIYAKIIWQL